MPLNKMFLISGNNTGTGILQKPDGLRRYRTDMRKRSRHHLHRHRFGIRTLERHHAQSLRPRPTVLQPAHRPRIPRGKENLSFRTSVRHPLTSETPRFPLLRTGSFLARYSTTCLPYIIGKTSSTAMTAILKIPSRLWAWNGRTN